MDAENYNGLRLGAVDISYGLYVGEPVTQPPSAGSGDLMRNCQVRFMRTGLVTISDCPARGQEHASPWQLPLTSWPARYLIPTTMELGPTRGSTYDSRKPASRIQARQSAPV
jgi:hypothetical protein